jgi:hypothetical protein
MTAVASIAQVSDRTMLLARARVARRLVETGQVDGLLALSYAVWPTPAILEQEQHLTPGTVSTRAFSYRGEAA